MNPRTLHTRGFLLRKEEAKSSYLKINFFSQDIGSILCMYRISKKKTAPDLFDFAELSLKKADQGDLYFIEDYQLLERFHGIGKDYKKLQYTCEFCKLLANNPIENQSIQALYSLCDKSLRAWNQDTNWPEVVFFKAFYLYLKIEGLPVKEDWIVRLKQTERNNCKEILTSSLDSLSHEKEIIEGLVDSLKKWVKSNAGFIFS